MKKKIQFTPIGIIHTPFVDPIGSPIQPKGGLGIKGIIDVFPEYKAGLKDLDGFSHIIILYHFHLVQAYALEVKPFLDEEPRVLFATRAPIRPNPIGLSVVKLIRVSNNQIEIEDVDIVDGTPLLDIKPYVPSFDHREDVKTGWLGKKGDLVFTTHADGRFNNIK